MRITTVLRRGIATRRARSLATTTAVAAAVAFLTSSFVLTDSIDAGVRTSAAQATSGVSVVVTDARGFGGSLLTGAPTLPTSLVDRVRHVSGVAAADGIVEGYAMPLDHDGHALSAVGGIGISVPDDPRLRLLSLREGTWPSAADEVVVDADTARRLALPSAGRRIRVALTTGARTFRVTGIVGFGNAPDIAGLSVLGFQQDAAPGLLASQGHVAAVEIAGTPDVAAATLVDRISHAVGGDYRVADGTEQAAQVVSQVGGATALIGSVLRVFAVVSLTVAALLIANIFTITVAQRTRELALLRCIGAGRSQTARLVLAEAGLVGLAGGVVGLPGGVGLAAAVRAILSTLDLPLPGGAPVLAPRTIVTALVVGIGVTLTAAGSAALRASRSRPLTALSAVDTTADTPRLGRPRRIIAALTTLAGAALLATATAIAPAGLGGLLLLTGIGLAGPLLVRPTTAPLRRAATAVTGFCGRLAGQQMLRNPRRVAGTTGTLTVAVATVSLVATMAATFSASTTEDVRRSLRADFVVGTTPGSGAALDPGLTARIAAAPGVASAVGLPCGIFKAPNVSDKACGVDPAAYPSVVDLHVSAGSLGDLAPGTMAVSALAAQRDNWRIGQTIGMTFPLGGTRQVRVIALYDYEQISGAYLIPATDFANDFPAEQQGLQTILVSAKPGKGDLTQQSTSSLLADFPQASLDTRSVYASRAVSGIELLGAIMTALLALSLLIGLISCITSLALSVLERTRETGLLRAVGAETRQIRALIRTEAIITVVTGSVLGVLLGLPIGWALAGGVMDGRLLGAPAVPGLLLAVVLPAAVLIGVCAAAVPARRATRLHTLDALRTEG